MTYKLLSLHFYIYISYFINHEINNNIRILE